MSDADDPVERARALLDANHTFPGPFEFRIVGVPEAREGVLAAIAAALGAAAIEQVTDRPSATGKYVALHVRASVASSDAVLATYAALREVAGVRAIL
jgi:putative lipoic acid-binding regulatory protein